MNNSKQKIRGFTLVEILVVVVIATVVLAIAIPRIRTINKERNIREASRVIGSAFANASQRAVIDGVAGVRISRNPNFMAGSLQYGATEISLLRSVPNYIGDAMDAEITNATLDNVIQINMPLEQEALGIISAGDSISFGNSPASYRITNAFLDTAETGAIGGAVGSIPRLMRLELDLNGYLPAPADGSTFSIARRPKILRSSTATLPAGHIIDLRYSGFELLDGFGPFPGGTGSFAPPYTTQTVLARQLTSIFEPTPTDFYDDPTEPFGVVENYDIDIIFDEQGSVDFVLYTEIDHNNNGMADEDGDGTESETVFRQPLGSIHLLVTEAPTSIDATEEIATADENNFWVTINNNMGSVNIGYNDSNASQGFTVADLSTFYFGMMPGASRSDFNAVLNSARSQAATSSANQ